VIVWPDVPEVPKIVSSPLPAVAVAERLTRLDCTEGDQIPGVPAAMQIQKVAVSSTIKSPTANVPEVGAPEVVPPTYRVAEVAPVRPTG